MNPGDRVRVTPIYGRRWPYAKDYVGAEGTVQISPIGNPAWAEYICAVLDRDSGRSGLFRPDELELLREAGL